MSRILIVEDARPIAQGIRVALEHDGYEVRIVADGAEALDTIRRWMPRFVILDLTLPSMDGIHVLRTIRSEGLTMPVLILSARVTELDRVRGLRAGADDYLIKPFSLDELLARIEAHFRRDAYQLAGRPQSGPDADLQCGKLKVTASTRIASYADAPLHLRPREFDLLHALARRAGEVITRTELLREVWGYEVEVESRTIDTHVVELRRKLREATGAATMILTVRKTGYRLLTSAE